MGKYSDSAHVLDVLNLISGYDAKVGIRHVLDTSNGSLSSIYPHETERRFVHAVARLEALGLVRQVGVGIIEVTRHGYACAEHGQLPEYRPNRSF